MSVQVEDLSPVEKKLTFVVDASTVDAKLDEAYRNLSKQVNMKGFRPGKVPRKVLERRFGRHIQGEVAGGVISDAFDTAMEEHGLTPVSQPIVDQGTMEKGVDYAFSVTVEIKPDLELDGWKGVSVEWESVNVTDEEVDAELQGMLQRAATVEAADEGHVLAEGDMAILDGSFTLPEGEPRELKGLMVLAGQATGMPSADWLKDHVVGMKIGDTKTEAITPPAESLGEEFEGSEGSLEITISEIKVQKLPELDDDFAQDVGHDTLDLLKADTRFKMEEQGGNHARGHAATCAIRKVLEVNEFDVPQGLVRAQAEAQLREQFQQFARQGLQMQLPTLDSLPEAAQNRFMGEAEFAVKQSLVLEAIAKAEGLEITDDDVDERIAAMAEEIGQHPAAIKGLLLKNNGMDGLKDRLLEEKALDALLENAEVIDVEPGWYHAHGDDHGEGDHDHDHDHDHGDDDHDHDHGDDAADEAADAGGEDQADEGGESEDAT
ncbi:MAG: trigger factor [Proteobacteria bacterium]|nr:trigger factor [Pseudomonadota bacterium]